jgi:putative sterol carrier protein
LTNLAYQKVPIRKLPCPKKMNWLYNRGKENGMADNSVSDFITRMAAAFVPEKAAGIDATIQLKLTGSQPGEWFFVIKDSQCKLNPGLADAPKLTISADGGDLIKIFSGQLDGMQAFMQGKLRVAGDMSLGLKLMNLFKIN